MPANLPFAPPPDLTDPAQQASYVEDAFLTEDPFLIVLALTEVGTARRAPVALDENPRLSGVLRAMRDMGLRLRLEPATSCQTGGEYRAP